MNKPDKGKVSQLPLDTIITVVAENEEEIQVRDMTYDKALGLRKKKNKKYKYKFYQKGFCEIKSGKKGTTNVLI